MATMMKIILYLIILAHLFIQPLMVLRSSLKVYVRRLNRVRNQMLLRNEFNSLEFESIVAEIKARSLR